MDTEQAAYNQAIADIFYERKDKSREKISYKELAKRTGLSLSTVKRLLAGDREFTLSQFTAVARALGFNDPGKLLEDAAAKLGKNAE